MWQNGFSLDVVAFHSRWNRKRCRQTDRETRQAAFVNTSGPDQTRGFSSMKMLNRQGGKKRFFPTKLFLHSKFFEDCKKQQNRKVRQTKGKER
jgi:hypothetical protein